MKPVPCLLFLVAILALQLPAQQKKSAKSAKTRQVAEVVVPDKLQFAAKPGKVTFNHAAHARREKSDCKVCHDSLWPRDAKAPLRFKSTMHQTMQENRTSCGFCHTAGGKAFPAKGNCTSRCHGVAAAAAAAAAKD